MPTKASELRMGCGVPICETLVLKRLSKGVIKWQQSTTPANLICISGTRLVKLQASRVNDLDFDNGKDEVTRDFIDGTT